MKFFLNSQIEDEQKCKMKKLHKYFMVMYYAVVNYCMYLYPSKFREKGPGNFSEYKIKYHLQFAAGKTIERPCK